MASRANRIHASRGKPTGFTRRVTGASNSPFHQLFPRTIHKSLVPKRRGRVYSTVQATMNEILTPPALSSDLILRLQALKPVRNETPLLQKTRANYEAATADIVGSEENPACSRCQNDAGMFSTCRTPGDIFRGACANCHWDELDVECSFHGQFIIYP